MANKAGKIWGQTELIHANGVLEFHRIEYKKLNNFLERGRVVMHSSRGGDYGGSNPPSRPNKSD